MRSNGSCVRCGKTSGLSWNEMNKVIRFGFVAIVVSTSLVVVSPTLELVSPAKATAVNQQSQKTTISLSRAELKQPNILTVSSSQSLTRLTGGIELNGRLLKKLNPNSTRVDLSPYLKPGKNIVAISGQYSPARTSVDVEFTSSNNHISQQMSGNGRVEQMLVIMVQN
jgi:hypothetical protein